MIKLPLKRVIILFVDGKSYLCRVIHAGQDIVTCVDCYERVVTPEGVFYIEDGLQGKVRFDRSKISGYKLVEDSELENIYEEEQEENDKLLKAYINQIARERRSQFKVITNPTIFDKIEKKKCTVHHISGRFVNGEEKDNS